MYIAFRWLLGLTVAMWVAMCCMDLILKRNQVINIGHYQRSEQVHKNITRRTSPQIKYLIYQQKSTASFHYVMFIAGALAVFLFNNKKKILMFTKRNFAKLDLRAAQSLTKNLLKNSNKTATKFYVVAKMAFARFWGKFRRDMSTFKETFSNIITINIKKVPKNVNLLLIQRLHEVEEERKTLGKLVIALVNENKSIKSKFQLDTLTKERLVKQNEETQAFIRDNRSRYLNFQQRYLVTHQENLFLAALVRKLSVEKEEAQKNLTRLICEIYSSKNSKLKAYCAHFIVCSKRSLLTSDARAEIEKFMQKSNAQRISPPPLQDASSNTDSQPVRSAQTWTRFEPIRITQSKQNECTVVSMMSQEPRLRGLPGEYVWTVKDKYGKIEKLYEYDSDLDNGDTIRRIKEYSVYFDRDCFFDCRNSSTFFGRDSDFNIHQGGYHDILLTRRKFLTGSEAFQRFLRRNQNNIVRFRHQLPATPIQCS